MKMIGTFITKQGTTADLTQEGMIRLYSGEGEGWSIAAEFPFHLDMGQGIVQMRKTIREMVEKLGECKIFAAKEVIGQLYYVLESSGFTSYEIEGEPEAFLDELWADTISETVAEEEKNNPAQLFEMLKPGYYHIDLKSAMGSESAPSSKQILQPFFRSTEFESLEIDCDHAPKWLEKELGCSFSILEETGPSGSHVTIRSKA